MKTQLLAGAIAVVFGTMMTSGAMASGHGHGHGGAAPGGMSGIRGSHAAMHSGPMGGRYHGGGRQLVAGYGGYGSGGGYYAGPGLFGPDLGVANGYDICPPGYPPYGNCSSLNTIGW